METLIALVIGALVAISVYLLLHPDLVRKLIGTVILTNGVLLLIFAVGRMTRAAAPLIPEGEKYPVAGSANPLSQALILTAIVIGFGLLAFSLVLVSRMYGSYDTIDADDLIEATLSDDE